MKKLHNIGIIKSVSVLTVSIMVFSAFGIGVMAEDNTDDMAKVFYGGAEHTLQNKPFISDSELYLPLRELMNICGVSNDDISYDNGKISVLFKANPDIWVTAEMNVGQNGVAFDKDLEYDILGIENIRSTTHPVILANDTAYIPVGMLIRIKNYYVSQNWDRRVYLNLLRNLEVRQYASNGKYDAVLSTPIIDVSGEKRYSPKKYINDGEDFFIGSVYGFDNRDFTHTEINGYYFPTDAHKCILVDGDNKVIAVMPYENFRHERVDPTPHGVSSWELAKRYIDDIRSDLLLNRPNAIPYGRGGLNVCQSIPRISQDGEKYQYMLPYCFVDFRYVVK